MSMEEKLLFNLKRPPADLGRAGIYANQLQDLGNSKPYRAPAPVFQSLKIENTFPEPHLVILANINKSKVHEVVLPHEKFFLSKF